MGFFQIIMLIIKYGPAIYQLVMHAIDLIKWLRKNDDDVAALGSEADIKRLILEKAKEAKRSKSTADLEDFIRNLEARKRDVLAKRT